MKFKYYSFFILLILTLPLQAKNILSSAVLVNLDGEQSQPEMDLINDFFYHTHCVGGFNLGWLPEVSKTERLSDGQGAIIEYNLVKDAFIKNDAKALTKLGQKLADYKEPQDTDGTEKEPPPISLDGIIVYASKPKPRFMSLTTPRNYKHKIKTYYIKNVNDKASIQDAFCKAIPHYTGVPK